MSKFSFICPYLSVSASMLPLSWLTLSLHSYLTLFRVLRCCIHEVPSADVSASRHLVGGRWGSLNYSTPVCSPTCCPAVSSPPKPVPLHYIYDDFNTASSYVFIAAKMIFLLLAAWWRASFSLSSLIPRFHVSRA